MGNRVELDNARAASARFRWGDRRGAHRSRGSRVEPPQGADWQEPVDQALLASHGTTVLKSPLEKEIGELDENSVPRQAGKGGRGWVSQIGEKEAQWPG